MSGSFLVDWAALAVSLFNTTLLLWLGLTVLFNAERRTWGIWIAGSGLLIGAAFFVIHSVILGLESSLLLSSSNWALNFWWRLGWIPVILAPLTWYVVMLWYAGYWEGVDNPLRRRHRLWLALLLSASLLMIALFIFANPLPSLAQISNLNLKAQPAILGVPLLILVYPLYNLGCIGLSLEALLHPGPTVRPMGHLARRRARPWLAAASGMLLLVSLLVAAFMGWVVLSARSYTPAFPLARAASWIDLTVASLIGASIVFTGQAIVSYEIFTGKALPRRGLLRYWRRAVILAGAYSSLIAFIAALRIAPIYSLLLCTFLLALLYAMLGWRSYAERERFIRSLHPFFASQGLYDQLLKNSVELDSSGVQSPFRALCEGVLGASRAWLTPLGSLSPLFGAAISYPEGAQTAAIPPAIASPGITPETLYLPLEPDAPDAPAWAIPLWNARGLCGALLLGNKADGGLYTQEEIEVARTAGERLLDLQVTSEIARRLVALQRRQLAESQVLDRRLRRALHDDVLPQLHTALLAVGSAYPSAHSQDALSLLSDVHRQIADLLHDLPSTSTPALKEMGLAVALQQVIEVELRHAFDQVSWEASPKAIQAASELPPLQAEVLFYAAREAVRNAARHARPASSNETLELKVRLDCDSELEILVEDNGMGIANDNGRTNASAGQGLALHSTLLAVIGGALSVESQPGAYTRLRISLPQTTSLH